MITTSTISIAIHKIVVPKTSCGDGVCNGGTNIPSFYYNPNTLIGNRSFLCYGATPVSSVISYGTTSWGYAWIGGNTAYQDLYQRPAL